MRKTVYMDEPQNNTERILLTLPEWDGYNVSVRVVLMMSNRRPIYINKEYFPQRSLWIHKPSEDVDGE